MNLVDSSGWLEYFAEGPGADFFAPAIEQSSRLLVPTLVLYEVCKRLMVQRGERVALEAIAAMRQSTVIDLTADLAIAGAQAGVQKQLPLADSIIYATARAHRAILWTQDGDFEGLEGVRFRTR